ncbi:MAG: hypothetical protein PF495_02530 [Spirochaetales bacterium]|jgi:shikimate kinase|nr:hypothetical protein [Spirochaetales bacterium]
MNTFYIDLLSIFFLFLTSVTCLFAMFGKFGLYWALPWLASTILGLIRLFRLFSPEAVFTVVSGNKFYLEMLTPVALLALFLSSILLRSGINKRSGTDDRIPEIYAKPNQNSSLPAEKTSVQPSLPEKRPGPESRYSSKKQDAEVRIAALAADKKSFEDIFSELIKTGPQLTFPINTHLVYVLGVKHSGKSTLGNIAAENLKIPFFDLDLLVLELFDKTLLEGKTIRDIYILFGKERFMQLEVAALRRFYSFIEHSQIPGVEEYMIISLGGGAADNQVLMRLIKDTGTLVYLYLPEQLLYQRVSEGGIPPFLDKRNPRESFHSIFSRRDAIYRTASHAVIKLSAQAQPQQNAFLLTEVVQRIIGENHG